MGAAEIAIALKPVALIVLFILWRARKRGNPFGLRKLDEGGFLGIPWGTRRDKVRRQVGKHYTNDDGSIMCSAPARFGAKEVICIYRFRENALISGAIHSPTIFPEQVPACIEHVSRTLTARFGEGEWGVMDQYDVSAVWDAGESTQIQFFADRRSTFPGRCMVRVAFICVAAPGSQMPLDLETVS